MKINFSENLFLNVSEFKRFQEYLSKFGFIPRFLVNVEKFGLVDKIKNIGLDVNKSNNFYVEKAGTPFSGICVNPGLAIDSKGNLIISSKRELIEIPNNSNWNWIKIKYKTTNLESGKVSIDSKGNVVGIGTNFLEILRGQPNYPTKLKFKDSKNGNSNEYEVVKVISDTSCIIQGDFVSESDLEYSIIGTFTPGFVVENDNKFIYEKDSVQISLVQENSLNEAPPLVSGDEFYLARVRFNGSNLVLQDKRSNWFKTKAESSISDIIRDITSSIIGIENIKFDIPTSDMSENVVSLSWAFRTESWTVDTASKRISILIGQGGIYKNTSNFKDGDFNGWRLYFKNGSFVNITDSIKSGTQIVITTDVLNPDSFNEDERLLICPPYENIEIRAYDENKLVDLRNTFSINSDVAKLKLPSKKESAKYVFTYRYKTFNSYTDWLQFPNDSIGYLNELSFNENGDKLPEVFYYKYEGSLTEPFIKLLENPESLDIFRKSISIGDKLGIKDRLFSNSEPLINLRVSRDEKIQNFRFDGNTEFTLTGNIIVNIEKFQDSDSKVTNKNGNEFIVHIGQWLNLDSYKILFVQDYVNPTEYKLLREITENDVAFIKNSYYGSGSQYTNGFNLKFIYNPDKYLNWETFCETDITPKGTVRIMSNVDGYLNGAFDSNGMGKNLGLFGWRLMTEMNDRFPKGVSDSKDSGQLGGNDKQYLNNENIPEHSHNIFSQPGGNQNDWPGSNDSAMLKNNNNWGEKAYIIRGNNLPANAARTSSVGSSTPRPINIVPKYKSFIYVEKVV